MSMRPLYRGLLGSLPVLAVCAQWGVAPLAELTAGAPVPPHGVRLYHSVRPAAPARPQAAPSAGETPGPDTGPVSDDSWKAQAVWPVAADAGTRDEGGVRPARDSRRDP